MITFCSSTEIPLLPDLLSNKALMAMLGIALVLKILSLFMPRNRYPRKHNSARRRGKSTGVSFPQIVFLGILFLVGLAGLHAAFPRLLWFMAIIFLLTTAAAVVCVIVYIKRGTVSKNEESEAESIPDTDAATEDQTDDLAAYRGKEGEWKTTEILQQLGENYRILNDIMLPSDDGGTTQIDHIVVSEFGIFVIETKNYSGWIFCNAKSRVWTQTLCGKGRTSEKHTFQNPIHQNYRHICVLAENLGISKEYFKSIVVFAGNATFKTDIPEGVIFIHQLEGYIKSFSRPIIKLKQLDEIASVIKQWDSTITDYERTSHAANLKLQHRKTI